MYNSLKSKSTASKSYVSHGTLPQYIDPEQPPSKKNPFSTILNQSFTHTVWYHHLADIMRAKAEVYNVGPVDSPSRAV